MQTVTKSHLSNGISVIGFDADDTLWHNETLFQMTHQRFETLLSQYHKADLVKEQLFETERRNLALFGYGVKGFTLSMIETAIQLTDGQITGKEIEKIIDFARQMLKAPVELIPHAEETVRNLSETHTLMLVTKGDLFDQESKIARSGLSHYFKHIEILTDKTKDAYQTVLNKHGYSPQQFLMVGNSMRSDILPVVEIGGHGVFIPYPLCWELEEVSDAEKQDKHFMEIKHIGQLPQLIKGVTNPP